MTIKDIARESGYAVGTVSRVINNNPNVSAAARARIMEVIERYNFQPKPNAKHLKQQGSHGVAMIVKGTSNLLLASILNRDFPVVLAIVVMLAFLVVFVNFLVDVLYQFIDPRIKVS